MSKLDYVRELKELEGLVKEGRISEEQSRVMAFALGCLYEADLPEKKAKPN